MIVSVYARTDVGRARPRNEDSFMVSNLSTAECWTPYTAPANLTSFDQGRCGSLLAISDGLGGSPAGDIAGRLAVECVREHMLELQAGPPGSTSTFPEQLRSAIEITNMRIYRQSQGHVALAGMGATLTVAGLHGATAYIAQIGDSRAYILRRGQLRQITHDQSVAGMLLETGCITAAQARNHPYRNVLLQAVGIAPRVEPVMTRLPLLPADILVLCSDGLSNELESEDLRRSICKSSSLKAACESLISLAAAKGEEDDITVLIAQVTGRWVESELAPPDTQSGMGIVDPAPRSATFIDTRECLQGQPMGVTSLPSISASHAKESKS